MDFGAILLGFFVAFVIKIFVMVLGGVFLLRIYRVTSSGGKKPWLIIPEENRKRFKILMVGLFFFFIAEFSCGIEMYILTRSNVYCSCFHGIASALSMALCTVGFFQLFDWKYFHIVDRSKACIASKTCGVCSKRKDGICQYRPLLFLSATLLFCMATPIFFASTDRIVADPRPYALPFESWNTWYDHSLIPWINKNLPNVVTDSSAFYLPEGMLILEFQMLPAIGMVLALGSIILLWFGREDQGIFFILLSTGVLSYSYFEVISYGLTRDAYFGSLVHEGGEFLFLVMAMEILLKMFPPPKEKKSEEAGEKGELAHDHPIA